MPIPRWPLLTAEEMRALDRHTIETLGIAGELLMECAGQLVAREAEALLSPGGRVWILCGAGNNGGDGWVAGRHLHARGVPVQILPALPPAELQGDAAANAARAERVGVPTGTRLRARAGDVIVDALFGTGLRRPVEGELARWIRKLVERPAGVRVLSVDLPSGLDADTGQVLGVAVEADATLTLGLPKLGLALEPGRRHAGQIRVGRIGILDAAPGIHPQAELWTRRAVGELLPGRPVHGHKGTFGHVLVVAGSEGMTGAAALAAHGASRSGAGLVTIACPASTNPILEVKCTEAMTSPVAETAEHALALSAQKAILELAASRDAVVLGPGVGRGGETLDLIRRLAEQLAVPLILDADGLLAFRGQLDVLKARQPVTIVTPHPGEAAALLDQTTAEVLADRPKAARALARASGAVVVLKGAGTVTAEPTGQLAVNPTGGPVLGTGGTGDVLAGVVGGFIAQGLSAFQAGIAGPAVHGAAGELFASRRGDVGLLAGELVDLLPEVLEAYRRTAEEEAAPEGDVLGFPEPADAQLAFQESH
ncbi:MAG: NAD(P)H-hydrate dehydratase [bacterium]|nr:NAD(P)H-hydrate dehydratase [bacterium]